MSAKVPGAPLPSVDELGRVFRPDFTNGTLFSQRTGKPVGTKTASGYIQVCLGRRFLLAHRVLWKMAHNEDPFIIDHINSITCDNRITNLRNVGHQESSLNRPGAPLSKSGHRGVYRHKKGWKVQLVRDQSNKHVGFFEDIEAAIQARAEAVKIWEAENAV